MRGLFGQRGACRLASLALAGLLALSLAACGSSDPQPRPVTLAILDATSSFHKFAPDCVPDFLTVARGVAARSGHLYAGPLLSGDPFSQTFTIDADFASKPPPSIQGNGALEDAYRT